MSDTNSAPQSAPVTNQSSNPEGSEGSEESNSTPSNQTPPPAKKKFKYKADNQEIEEELDDSEIASRLSLAKAAQKRMQEASMTKKQAEQFFQALQNDPMSVLSNEKIMGQKKFREIAERFLLQQIEQESLTPEQRAQAEKDRRLQEYERQEKEQKSKAEQEQLAHLENHYAQEYQKTIISALNSSSLPKNDFTVARMASLLQKNLQHGLDLPPQALAQLVREDYERELKSLIGSSEGEQILRLLGEDVANKIRKHDLSKFQLKNPGPKRHETVENEPPKKMSSREHDEWLRSKWQKK